MHALKSYFTPATQGGREATGNGVAARRTEMNDSTHRPHPFSATPSPPAPPVSKKGSRSRGWNGKRTSKASSDSNGTPSIPESGPWPGPAAIPMTEKLQNPPKANNLSVSGNAPSFRHSRGSSIRYPNGDFRNSQTSLVDLKTDMMVNWLHEQQLRKQYVSYMYPSEGVVLKKERGTFTCCPPAMRDAPGSLFDMVVRMNVRCAMTVNTPVVRAITNSMKGIESDHVPLPDGLRIQILGTMTDLPRCQLHHFAAFIEDMRILVVWDDDPERLLQRAQTLEQRVMEIIWGDNNPNEAEETADGTPDEKKGGFDENSTELDPAQLEEALSREHRPVRLENACYVAATLALAFVCLGLGWKNLAMEVMVDGSYTRVALVVVGPVQLFASLFFFQALVGNLAQIFGPISAVSTNSKYYSGKAPKRLNRKVQALPHVTIQMPVYREGLNAVIKPTVVSLKAAISTYEMQGGTASIFVNDDGMQLLGEDEAQARRDFYDEHNIGWVARPKHNPKPAGEGERPFFRRGKFKKASNMNYALRTSNLVEERLLQVRRGERWTQEAEDGAYLQCLADVLQEDEGRTWAEGSIRVGDYILLIDSDTRVPADCLLDAVSEMEQSPQVAIIQFSSGVMNVSSSFFEKGVTWFTNLIYSAITFAVASGDACPFVGHNALLRWQALQEAASYEDEDGYEKYWSESHVSEDFDMALRLQVAGYSLRYAAYTGDGFKEGVSLTVYDELARWEKYAYGCNELLFHPLRFWVTRGPFTPLFRRFLFSSIPFPKKVTICAYIGTYYAIASAWLLTLFNFFLTGWFWGVYDKYYIDSFAIYMGIIAVFTALGNVALAVLRYRLGEKTLLGAFFENLKWIPMFTIFMGGISLHVSQAILSHFFEVDMAWGATAKEVEEVNFGTEAARILKRFKGTFAFCLLGTALMVSAYSFFPHDWRITTFASIYPFATVVVSHFLLPVTLNPALMMFSW